MPKIPYILLVDDDSTTNFLNSKLLERLGVADQVAVAHNGREALDLLLARCNQHVQSPPVLVFLDVNMPIMNGIQFLEAYQELPPAQQCAMVVMLTTSMHPQDVQRVERLPVADFIAKPLTQQHVERVLHTHFTPA